MRPACGVAQHVSSIVARERRSSAAERKIRRQQTGERERERSLDTLVADLQTLTKNEVRITGTNAIITKYTRPTPLQQKAFDLLGVSYRP